MRNPFQLDVPLFTTSLTKTERRASAVTSGLQLDIDMSKLTGANGTSISQVNDQSGNNRHATQGNPINYPTLVASAQNGLPGVRFGGGDTTALITPDFLDATYNTAVTIFAVRRRIPTVEIPSIDVSYSASGVYSSTNNNDWEILEQEITALGANKYMGQFGSRNTFIEMLRYDGTTRTFGSGYSLFSRDQTGNINLSGGFYLGTLKPSGYKARVDYFEFLVYNRALSEDESYEMIRFLDQKWNVYPGMNKTNMKNRFIFVGDSLTLGLGPGGGTIDGTAVGQAHSASYPNQLMAQIGAPYYNFAVGSHLVSQVLGQCTNAGGADAKYSTNYAKNILFVWAGTNDLAKTTATATTTYNGLVSLCQGRRALGYKVLIVTILPRSDSGNQADFEAKRNELNDLIKANYTTFADGIVDLTTDTTISATGAELNTTYYSGDKVHMTKAGYGRVATVARNAVLPLL